MHGEILAPAKSGNVRFNLPAFAAGATARVWCDFRLSVDQRKRTYAKSMHQITRRLDAFHPGLFGVVPDGDEERHLVLERQSVEHVGETRNSVVKDWAHRAE